MPDPQRTALVCPRCRHVTTERTSTSNGFCRACDCIFAKDALVPFSQDEAIRLLALVDEPRDEKAELRAALKALLDPNVWANPCDNEACGCDTAQALTIARRLVSEDEPQGAPQPAWEDETDNTPVPEGTGDTWGPPLRKPVTPRPAAEPRATAD